MALTQYLSWAFACYLKPLHNFSIKMSSYQDRNSHHTKMRCFRTKTYLYKRNSFTGKITSFYCNDHHSSIIKWVNDDQFTEACFTRPLWVNSLAPGKFEWNCRHVVFKQILVIDGWSISCEISLIWMSLDFIDDQSTSFQVMTWCHQVTSHYLNQCWPRSLSPYDVTRPQWVKMQYDLRLAHAP